MAIVAPSFDDLITLGISEAQTRRADLRFLDGDVSEAQLHAAGAMADACVRYAAQLFRNRFLDGAKGEGLTALVDDTINGQRQQATAAQGTVAFTRAAVTGPAGTISAGTKVGTSFEADGRQVTFTTDVDLAFALNQQGPLSVAVTASDTGPSGNAAAGTVTKVISSLFDTFTVTNPVTMAGGNAEEGDDALRARARTFYATLRRATLDALEAGALLVPEVRVAIAIEDPDSGDVTVRVSDEDGNSTLQMLNDVEAELEAWRAAGVNVNVIGGSTLTVDMVIQLDDVSDGFNLAVNGPAITAAVESLMNKRRVGETLRLDSVTAASIGVSPDEIFALSFLSITVGGVPQAVIGDIIPAVTQLIRPGTITVQVAA